MFTFACRYVTLRRNRPQPEQQQEESTIKHTGETVVIEDEIKPVETEVEEPISTSVRPKLKVSESTSASEPVFIVTAEPLRTTETPPTITTESATLFTESNTEADTLPTELSSSRATTVPYQTSTLTSIVTVVVEGATERKRVPITKLKQALADHDLLANSLPEESKNLVGKSSVPVNAKEDVRPSNEKEPEEKTLYRPIGNFRGNRPRKPIIIEQPTTKALPLYLQRKRKTTTETPSAEVTSTEDSQSTKPKIFGRFTPTRVREQNRGQPLSTEPSSLDDLDTSTQRTNRYRTTRPSVGGSRFTTARGRTRSTTESSDSTVEENKKRKTFGNNEEKDLESLAEKDKKRRKFVTKDKGDEEGPKQVLEKPTRLFSRGRIRSTTEKIINISDNSSTTVKPINRSRFVINRGRNQTSDESTQRTRLTPLVPENKRLTNISSGGSRFQIQRRRKPKNETESGILLEKDNEETSTEGLSKNSTTEEDQEMLISQENSSIKPSQLLTKTSNITVEPQNLEPISLFSANNKTTLEVDNTTLVNQSQNIEKVHNKTNNSTSTEIKSTSSTSEPSSNISVNTTNDYLLADGGSLKGGFLNNSKDTFEDSSPALVSTLDNENDTFDDSQSDGEDLNVIASRYSEQSFTGGRGSVRFQGQSENEGEERSVNSINDNGKRTNPIQSRRRKVNNLITDKLLNTSKSNDEKDQSSRRRKVLVRKSKVADELDSTIGTSTANTVGSASSKRRNIGLRDRSSSNFQSKEKEQLVSSNQSYNRTRPRNSDASQRAIKENNYDELTNFSEEEFRKVTTKENDEVKIEEANNRRRKVKVLKGRSQVNSFEHLDSSDLSGSKRRVLVRKKAKTGIEVSVEDKKPAARRGVNRFQTKDLSDLDTETSLFVQRETESDGDSRGSFPRSVKDQYFGNSLTSDPLTRGKIKAKDSLLEDIEGVLGEDEDSTDDPTDDQSEVG